jgi:hypothetical protein
LPEHLIQGNIYIGRQQYGRMVDFPEFANRFCFSMSYLEILGGLRFLSNSQYFDNIDKQGGNRISVLTGPPPNPAVQYPMNALPMHLDGTAGWAQSAS